MYSPEVSVEVNGNVASDTQPTPTDNTLTRVKVYTRHNRNCPKRDRPDWARCHCVKWLYIYRDGKDKLVSAKTRSWEKAEQKAREVWDSFDPVRHLQRQLEAKTQAQKSQLEISVAVENFSQEIARLNRAEATRAKYTLTLNASATVIPATITCPGPPATTVDIAYPFPGDSYTHTNAVTNVRRDGTHIKGYIEEEWLEDLVLGGHAHLYIIFDPK